MAYDFSRFSPQSFEQMVQALVVDRLGMNTQIFGAGKDGAREATFEGRARVNPDETWDGYIVIQAKYQALVGASPENAKWLIRQIDAEMEKFADSKRALRRPDYYILATNSRLSAAAADHEGKGGGGIDEVSSHFSQWLSRLGIKGFVLWHADTLGALLDAAPGVRERYDFWISPGDVLTAALRMFKDSRVERHIPDLLRSQLRHGRDIKTKDAGQTTGRKIVLDDIFIDLPLDQSFLFAEQAEVFESADGDADLDFRQLANDSNARMEIYQEPEVSDVDDEGDPDYDAYNSLVLHKIMTECADQFGFGQPDTPRYPRGRTRNRVLLMGGPGQGKSTVCQFLAQIYRSRLLNAMSGNSFEVGEAVRRILKRATDEKIPLVGPARFPFLVDLPAYADALSKATRHDSSLSILTHIAALLGRGEAALTVEALRSWLRTVPSIFILDGLDEVPHSSNRDEVLEAINALIDVVHAEDADCFLLVTSRPQGYQGELDRRQWRYWVLEDLEKADALRFSEQLGAILVTDKTRRAEIQSDLKRAAQEDATAQLMKTPLQVSLLFALVETRNNIPKDRWTLFFRYYEILRDREIAKGGQNGALIGQYRPEIDRLHYETGYLLHLRGESTGSASPFLTKEEFGAIVAAQLTRSEYGDVADLTERIVTLATTRLVFLRCRTAENIAFEVRSLQEFMAAARIMASPESRIRSRLREIAGISHWLHVFKIACSKVYSSADLEALREEIIAILDALDSGDRRPEDGIAKTGATLALALLHDGVVGSAPVAKRHLAARALRLVAVADETVALRLAEVVDMATFPAVQEGVADALRTGGEHAQRNSIRLLLLLLRARDITIARWAEKFLAPWLPRSPSQVLATINSRRMIPPEGEMLSWLLDALWKTSIGGVRRWGSLLNHEESPPHGSSIPFELMGIIDRSVSRIRYTTPEGKSTPVTFDMIRVGQGLRVETAPEYAHAEWVCLHRLAQFERDLDPSSLASWMHSLPLNSLAKLPLNELPWIVVASIDQAQRDGDPSYVISALKDGAWGCSNEWRQSENAWLEAGVRAQDFVVGQSGSFFFPGLRSPPRRYPGRNSSPSATVPEVIEAINSLEHIQPLGSSHSDILIVWYLSVTSEQTVPQDVGGIVTRQAVKADTSSSIAQHLKALFHLPDELIGTDDIWLSTKQLIDRLSLIPPLPSDLLGKVCRQLLLHPERRALLVIAAGVVSVSSRPRYSVLSLIKESLEQQSGDGPLTSEAVQLLRLHLGMKIDAVQLVTTSLPRIRRAFQVPRSDQKTPSALMRDLVLQRLDGPISTSEAEAAYGWLREMVEKTPSELGKPSVFTELQLPPPV